METKDYILFESFKLFLSRGFDKVSMNDLVKASGLSKGAFYHYFKGKEEIFREAIQNYFFTGLSENSFSPSKELGLLDNLLNLIEYKSELYKQLLETTGLTSLSSGYFTMLFQALELFPDFREALVFAGSSEESMLSEIFEIAQKQGEIEKVLKPIELARIYATMLDGMELHSVVSGDFDKLHAKEKEATIHFTMLLLNKKKTN